MPAADADKAVTAISERLVRMGFDWAALDEPSGTVEERKEQAVEFIEGMLRHYARLVREIGDLSVKEALSNWKLAELLALSGSCAVPVETLWVARKDGVERIIVTDNESIIAAMWLVTAAKDVLFLDSHW